MYGHNYCENHFTIIVQYWFLEERMRKADFTVYKFYPFSVWDAMTWDAMTCKTSCKFVYMSSIMSSIYIFEICHTKFGKRRVEKEITYLLVAPHII